MIVKSKCSNCPYHDSFKSEPAKEMEFLVLVSRGEGAQSFRELWAVLYLDLFKCGMNEHLGKESISRKKAYLVWWYQHQTSHNGVASKMK